MKTESPEVIPTRISPQAFEAAIIINCEFETLMSEFKIRNKGNRKSTDALAKIIQLAINKFCHENAGRI